jgi:hypothetical protein
LLADKISIDEFEDWSASFSWNIHKRADAETQKLAYLIRAILNSHEDDETEDQLREHLALAAGPLQEIASESWQMTIVSSSPLLLRDQFNGTPVNQSFVLAYATPA